MKHIVMLDDDDQLVNSVRRELEQAGYRFSAALPDPTPAAGEPGDTPDLVVLDLMGTRALEPVRRLQHDPELRAVPVILLSGVRKVLDLPLAPGDRPLPVRAFVEKPFVPQRLRKKIDEILREE